MAISRAKGNFTFPTQFICMAAQLFQKPTFLFIVVFLNSFPLFGSTPGTVIVLYGAHCGGKSTLAEELTKKLPEKYIVVSKRPIVDAKRKDYIESLTGKRPTNRQEIIAAAETLEPKKRKKALRFSNTSIRDMLLEIKQRAEKGENLIFPVCLKDPSPLSVFADIPHVNILVHAPLSTISQRDIIRAERYQFSESLQNKRRRHVMCTFVHLFVPMSLQDTSCIDTLRRRDIDDFATESQKRGFFQNICDVQKTMIDHFGLNQQERVGITPKYCPDLVINTGTTPIDEAAKVIVKKMALLSKLKEAGPKEPDSRVIPNALRAKFVLREAHLEKPENRVLTAT